MNIQVRNLARARKVGHAPGVRQAISAQERAQAFSIITYGFTRDPIARWIWPTADAYACHMLAFVEAFSGRALEHGTVELTSCGGAAAFWLPPGISPDQDAVMAVLEQSISPERSTEMEEFFVQMASFHPKDPCWYLPQIAADPAYQGRGLGSALLEHRLRIIDASGVPAYLESSSPRNIALYRRHGFELVGEIQAGSSPRMFPMVRKARS